MYLTKGEVIWGVLERIPRILVIGGEGSKKCVSLVCTFLEKIMEGFLTFSVPRMKGR